MICEIHKSYLYGDAPFIVPVSHSANDLYNMLEAAFPYNRDTHDSRYGMWQFYMAGFEKDSDSVNVVWIDQHHWS